MLLAPGEDTVGEKTPVIVVHHAPRNKDTEEGKKSSDFFTVLLEKRRYIWRENTR
jgi:hypothetical protein